MPRTVAKPPKVKEADAWTEQELSTFLTASADHRWAVLFRIEVLFGPRRSELLALRWDDVDDVAGTLRIDEGLVPLRRGVDWTPGKSARSRRVIALDPVTRRMLVAHRAAQAEERLKAGPAWEDNELLCCTRTGTAVIPRNFDRSLTLVVQSAGVRRLTSHGLRHTAATQMVRTAADAGELRAVADALGHSPDTLLRVYAHTLPESLPPSPTRSPAAGGSSRASRRPNSHPAEPLSFARQGRLSTYGRRAR
jgi:integrase